MQDKGAFTGFFLAEVERGWLFFGNCLEALFYQLFSELLFWSSGWEVLGTIFVNEGRAL